MRCTLYVYSGVEGAKGFQSCNLRYPSFSPPPPHSPHPHHSSFPFRSLFPSQEWWRPATAGLLEYGRDPKVARMSVIPTCFACYLKDMLPTVLIVLSVGKIWHSFKTSVVQTQIESNTNICYRIYYSPSWCGSVDWVPAYEPKRWQFNSQLGHMPGLLARSSMGEGGTRDATTHWCFCLSLLPSFPLSKYNKILKEKKNILQIGTCFGSLVYIRSQNPLNWITSLASSGKWVYIQGWAKAGLQFWVHETVYSCITYLYYNCKPTFANPCMF